MKTKKYDFCGFATKAGLKCSDGRTILQNAFSVNDGETVPLVWQHLHNEPDNVLGHALLENRKEGVYTYCTFNDTESGQTAKKLVDHGDITSLSIFANSLVEKAKQVVHGVIREVSLVVSGANPGAKIENLAIEHADGSTVDAIDEAIITTGETIELTHADPTGTEGALSHAGSKKKDDDNETIGEVFDTLTPKQKTAVYAMIAHALEADDDNDDDNDDDDDGVKHSNTKGEDTVKKNIFDKKGDPITTDGQLEHANVLTREELRTIFSEARQSQSTLKNAFLAHGYENIADAYAAYEDHVSTTKQLKHAGDYGIDNIGYLFPDYKTTSAAPTFLKRDTDWVVKVFGAAKHTPFARIKTVVADITADEARARGYVTGKQKVDEVITLLKRTTDPQTIYKKQRLDRDDVIDITDFDVIVWLRAEMRMMLEEEIGRAQLIGDGRSSASDDKIRENTIRPIATDDELYTIAVTIPEEATTSQIIDQIILGRKKYKGTGTPSFFTTPDVNGDMLLLKDSTGRRLYNTEADLSAGLRAKEIVEVPVMENTTVVITAATAAAAGVQKRLVGISVNMDDYSLGADKGGNVAMFDDFDIDFNRYKYLIETRCSGALTMPHSAIAYWKLETIPKLES